MNLTPDQYTEGERGLGDLDFEAAEREEREGKEMKDYLALPGYSRMAGVFG